MPKIYKRNCDICGIFYVGRGNKFCSQACYKKQPYSEEHKIKIGNSLRGVPKPMRSEIHKKRISESKTGKNHPFWGKRGVDCHNFGRKRSEETRRKHSNSISGEKAPNWRGGITPVNEIIRKSWKYKAWRKKVFERDNYTCIICGQRGCRLQADHIKPFSFFPELRFSIENGRTLCEECHKKTETYGARAYLWIKENGYPVIKTRTELI